MESLTIGKVARLAEVGIETIRFYEREGLIGEPRRRESGYREYPEETVLRLRFIRRAKELGFTLKEIKELLALRIEPETTCRDIRSRTEAKINDIETKIRTLQKMKEALTELTLACKGQGPLSECPILKAMQDEEGAKTTYKEILL
jgi:MerR family mercuric resistance operon transcriptional regulator